MSSVVIKIGSLVIKSLSKPIANRIKTQAREHERFRRICIGLAQRVHRWDMRFRLGLLQDQASIDKQIAREAAEAQAKRHRHEVSTAKTEGRTIADEAAAKMKERNAEKADKTEKEKAEKEKKKPPKIRPLSEPKAIDSGANFVSETFLLIVAVGCVVGERWYSSKKDTARREDVADRLKGVEEYEKKVRESLVALENELQEKAGVPIAKRKRMLPKEVYDFEDDDDTQAQQSRGWFSWLTWNRAQAERPTANRRPNVSENESEAPLPLIHPPAPTLYEKIMHPTTSGHSKDENSDHHTTNAGPNKSPSSQRPTSS